MINILLTMDRLFLEARQRTRGRPTRVTIAWLLLKMTFDPITAQLLPKPRCPTCQEGYFVKKNCSVITTSNEVKTEGVQCQLCTDCSAADQDTLVKCSTFADSLCGDRSAPAVTPMLTATGPPVSAPEVWIILTVIGVSFFLLLLLSLLLILLACRNRRRDRSGSPVADVDLVELKPV